MSSRKQKTKKNKVRPSKKQQTLGPPSFWQQHWQALSLIFLLGFGLYSYSTSFDYALDDQLYITGNQFTQQGFAGIPDLMTKESLYGFFGQQKDLVVGGRYRPLPIVTYAVEYQLFGLNPGISHFINILLYCLTGILLFKLLLLLLPPDKPNNTKWYLTLPFVAVALYMVHPLHVEVIANIKGRVEIMTLLGALITLYYSLRFIKTDKLIYLLASGVSFFLALLCKESAITFLAIIPITIYFFTKASITKNAIALGMLMVVTSIFLLIRYLVIGHFLGSGQEITELLNDPFIGASMGEKYATIFYTMGLYLQKLFLPLTLTHDYYPKQIPIIGWTDWRAIVSLLLYLALGTYALVGLFKKDLIAYGIIVYLASFSIVSNLFFPIGTFMNERFMYIPSIGFCLIIAYLLTKQLPKVIKKPLNSSLITGIILGLLTLYGIRTLVRVPVWQDNETLFLTDVHHSPNSTKVNTAAGGTLLEKANKQKAGAKRTELAKQAKTYLTKALELHPTNPNALFLMGNAEFELNRNYTNVFKNYYPLLELNPSRTDVLTNLALFTEAETDPKKVDQLVDFIENKVIPLKPNSFVPYDALGILYGKKKNNLDKAITYFEKARTFSNHDVGTVQDLAIAYGMKKDYDKALQLNFEALEMPKNGLQNQAKIYLNIAITYQNMGKQEKAEQYFKQAFSLDPSLQR